MRITKDIWGVGYLARWWLGFVFYYFRCYFIYERVFGMGFEFRGGLFSVIGYSRG